MLAFRSCAWVGTSDAAHPSGLDLPGLPSRLLLVFGGGSCLLLGAGLRAGSTRLGGIGDSTGETHHPKRRRGVWVSLEGGNAWNHRVADHPCDDRGTSRDCGRGGIPGDPKAGLAALGREGNGSGVGQGRGEPGKDHQIDVQRHALDPAHPQRKKRPLVLQAPELPLYGTTAAVQGLPPLRLARDQRVQPVGLDPYAPRGALTRRVPVLGRAALGVGTGEGPRPVLARWRQASTRLDRRGGLQGDDRADATGFDG